MAVWLAIDRWEFINAMSKSYLQLFFWGNKPSIGNKQRGLKRLRLVAQKPKNLSDKACLYILKAQDVSWVRAGLSIKQDINVGIRGDKKVSARRDVETGIGR